MRAWPYTLKIPPMALSTSEPRRSAPNPTTPRDAYRSVGLVVLLTVGLAALLTVGLAALVPGLSRGWNWVSGHGTTSTTGILFLIILIFGGSAATAYACRGLWSCLRPSRD